MAKTNYSLKSILGLLLCFALLALPIFAHLSSMPFQLWDESRNAINAWEMLKNDEFIAITFYDEPEMWNTKPPLLMWAQAFFISFLGLNETAVRLPSALAALFCCMILFWFFHYKLKLTTAGLIACFILVSAGGFLGYHRARNGDFDSLLTLFLLCSSLYFYLYLQEKKNKWLYLFFVSLTLAVMTKSVAGLMFVPAWLLWLLWQKKLLLILKNKHFYIGLLLFALVIVGYYFWRNQLQPGFWRAVVENELGGRFLNTLENHNHPFVFYFGALARNMRFYWVLIVPGIILGFSWRQFPARHFFQYASLVVLSFLILISASQTKLTWYDMPAFPWLALLAALPLYWLYQKFNSFSTRRGYPRALPSFLILFLLLFYPYYNRLQQSLQVEQYKASRQDDIGYFLKEAIDGHFNLNHHFLINDDYDPHLALYIKMLNAQGVEFSKKLPEALSAGNKVVVYRQEDKELVHERFHAQLLHYNRSVAVYKLLAGKT